jgi:hypothetical protein
MIELAIDELDKTSGGDPNLGSYVYRDDPGGWGIYVPQPPDPPTPHNPGVSAGSSAPSRSACSAEKYKISYDWLLCGDLKGLARMEQRRKDAESAALHPAGSQPFPESFLWPR